MVYYRKYRPQKISDLDSTAVRETLQAVLSQNVPHAFIFTGPKGLGKTSTARIVAKSVNCEKKKEGAIEPCNTCDQCISITNGTNMDVLEIDAASNRGIDEIRDLKEKIRLAPVSSKMKVYIIDEVHMLTTEAFNALLKTLEEPPAHAMFILATTEPHKVPATILSRCFHINFSLATEDEIVHSLKRISAGEKLNVDDDALYEIAKIADGGFRDAAKALEEVVLLANGKRITKDLFENLYKTANIFSLVFELLDALSKREAKLSLELVQKVVHQGIDIRYFMQQAIANLHEHLLVQMQISDRKVKKNDQLHLTTQEIAGLVDLLSRAYQETRYAVVPQLPLELAIIEWCAVEHVREAGDSNEPNVRIESSEVTVSSLRKQVGTIKKTHAMYGAPKKEKDKVVETTTVELHHTPGDGTITKEWLDHFWKNLIAEMKNHNHTAAGVLRSCTIESYDKKTLVISTAYKFHKERLEDFKTKDALIAVCKMLTGKTVEVAIELKK